MKNKLPVLTLVVVIAVGGAIAFRRYEQQRERVSGDRKVAYAASMTAAAATPSDPTAGDQLVIQARTQLERRTSVTARLRHEVSLGGRQLSGFGGYWQQGTGENLHMRLELKFANDDTTLLQASNGRFLWADERLPSGRMISRLDLRKVRSEWSRAEEEQEELESGRVSWAVKEPELSIRYGGLPTLLSSLTDCFWFMPPQSMRWTPAPPLEGVPAAFPVFAVVGHWKPARLALFVPPGEDATVLPERLPQEVLILFGQSDLFPYRIEYRQQLNPPQPPTAGGAIPPFQLSSEPLVLLELSNVSFDSQIAAGQFDYSPGDAEWHDRTDDYLEAMRLKRDARVARKPKVRQ